MKKEIIIVIILAIIIVILAGVLLWPANKPAKKNPQPVIGGIEIISPKVNDTVSFPIKITGVVNGNGWAGFEGQAGTVELKQGNLLLSRAILQATTEWTQLPTSFEANISELLVNCGGNSNCIISGDTILVFKNENPSGDPSRDKTFTLPIKIK